MTKITFLKKASSLLPVRSLKFLLHDHLAGTDPARSVSTLHASELTKEGFCPRFYALADVLKAKLPERRITTAEQVTFFHGHSLQDGVVNWFAEMGRAVGHWRCLACNQLHEFQPRPVKCKSCGCRAFKPEEVRFESAVSGASCGIDMLANMGKPLLTPVEIKTMAADEFKKLSAPLAEHRLRTTLYLRIIAESDHPWRNRVDMSHARVLYVSKGTYGTEDKELQKWGLFETYSPFKEYELCRDDSLVTAQHEMARVVKKFRDGSHGMPVGVCPTGVCSRAKACSLAKACWSGDYPPVWDWKAQGGASVEVEAAGSAGALPWD